MERSGSGMAIIQPVDGFRWTWFDPGASLTQETGPGKPVSAATFLGRDGVLARQGLTSRFVLENPLDLRKEAGLFFGGQESEKL